MKKQKIKQKMKMKFIQFPSSHSHVQSTNLPLPTPMFNLPPPLFPLLASIFLLLSSCGNKNKEQQTKTETRNVPTVLVSNPQTHPFNASLQISGTAKPNQSVKLYAMTNGFLQQVKADIGDFVKEGQILAVLENPELFSEKSKLEAELKGKKSIYDRLKGIYEKTPQLTTISDVEKTEAEYESINAQLKNVLQQINFLNVKAPFSGVIVNRFADKGAIIQSGLNSNAMPLFEIHDVQPIRLTIDVPETDAALISKSTKVEVTFPEMPDLKFSSVVSRIAYGLDETTKTMKVEIDLPNVDLKIRSGMYAKVEIQRSGHKDALSVPNEAIGNIKGQSFIYVVEGAGSGKEEVGRGKEEVGTSSQPPSSNSHLPSSNTQLFICKKIEVKTGIRDEKFTELLSGEIKSTDKIVVQGKEFCSDEASVQIKELTTK